jgi:hypothetical protein
MRNAISRIEKLEMKAVPLVQPRIMVLFGIDAATAIADGQWFHRADGETEAEMKARARAAVGWHAARAA